MDVAVAPAAVAADLGAVVVVPAAVDSGAVEAGLVAGSADVAVKAADAVVPAEDSEVVVVNEAASEADRSESLRKRDEHFLCT